jgi:hypothetical protein
MNCKYPDIQMLELIHQGRPDQFRESLPPKWEIMTRDMAGKALRAYVLIELLKVNEQLGSEPDEVKLRRLQGKAEAFKQILKLIHPHGAKRLLEVINGYVKQVTSNMEN